MLKEQYEQLCAKLEAARELCVQLEDAVQK